MLPFRPQPSAKRITDSKPTPESDVTTIITNYCPKDNPNCLLHAWTVSSLQKLTQFLEQIGALAELAQACPDLIRFASYFDYTSRRHGLTDDEHRVLTEDEVNLLSVRMDTFRERSGGLLDPTRPRRRAGGRSDRREESDLERFCSAGPWRQRIRLTSTWRVSAHFTRRVGFMDLERVTRELRIQHLTERGLTRIAIVERRMPGLEAAIEVRRATLTAAPCGVGLHPPIVITIEEGPTAA